MSSRHHIDDFMRDQIIGKIEEGRKINRCCQGARHRSQRCFNGCKSFKTTGMCSRRHGEVVLEVRRKQKTDISSYQQKRNRRTTARQVQISFLPPQKADLPKNCCQTFEGRRTIRTQTCCCVPLNRQHRTARLVMVRREVIAT
ncbi:hypothetical protein TNCV_1340401 [Trichonephila clavipes]|nr:hypothetical protein TNCV_1340401 [Trichonephila clavipes]